MKFLLVNSKVTKYLFYLLHVAIYIKAEIFSMVVSISSSVNGANVYLPRPTVRNNSFPALHTLTGKWWNAQTALAKYTSLYFIYQSVIFGLSRLSACKYLSTLLCWGPKLKESSKIISGSTLLPIWMQKFFKKYINKKANFHIDLE